MRHCLQKDRYQPVFVEPPLNSASGLRSPQSWHTFPVTNLLLNVLIFITLKIAPLLVG